MFKTRIPLALGVGSLIVAAAGLTATTQVLSSTTGSHLSVPDDRNHARSDDLATLRPTGQAVPLATTPAATQSPVLQTPAATAEPGDDNDAGVEPGDDRGAALEPGDDNGGGRGAGAGNGGTPASAAPALTAQPSEHPGGDDSSGGHGRGGDG